MRFLSKLCVLSLFGLVVSAFAFGGQALAGKITGGEDQSCAVTPAGGVVCWGQRSTGSLGDGLDRGLSYDPVPVVGIKSGATDVAGTGTGNGGSQYACAIVSGALRCWGTGGYGTLGDGKMTSSKVPVQATGLTSGVTAVSLNATYGCAIQSGGLKCWGNGNLGGNPDKRSPVPVPIPGLTSGVTGIAAGWRHVCAIAGGKVFCWAGTGDPEPVDGLTGATAIAAGTDFTCAIVGGGVSCWGRSSIVGRSADPVQMKGLESGVTAIAANGSHVCALKSGSVWCWGYNNGGQLGNGAKLVPGVGAPTTLVPAAVVGLSGVTSIGVGRSHSCAIAAGDALWCWGSNGGGKLGSEAAGSWSSRPVRVTGALRPTVVVSGGAKRVGSAAATTIATIKCPAGGACLVKAPKSVTVRVGGKPQALTLTATSAIGAGKTGTVALQATAAGAAALKGKTATAAVKLAVTRNDLRTSLSFSARLTG